MDWMKPTRLLCPWGSPGKNIGVGCHFLLQGVFLNPGLNPRPLHRQEDFLTLSHCKVPPPQPLLPTPTHHTHTWRAVISGQVHNLLHRALCWQPELQTVLWGQDTLLLALVPSLTGWGLPGWLSILSEPQFPYLQMDAIVPISKSWKELTYDMQLKGCLVNFRCSTDGSSCYYYFLVNINLYNKTYKCHFK